MPRGGPLRTKFLRLPRPHQLLVLQNNHNTRPISLSVCVGYATFCWTCGATSLTLSASPDTSANCSSTLAPTYTGTLSTPTFIQSDRLVIDWTTFKVVAKSLQGARDVQLLPNLQSLEVNSWSIRGLSTQMLIPFFTGGNVTIFESHCALSCFGRCLARGELKTSGYYEPSLEIVRWPDQQDALLIPALRYLVPKIHTLDALRLRLSYGQQLLPLLHPAAETLLALDIEIKRLIGAVPDYGLDNLRSLTARKQKALFVCALAGSPYLEHVHLQDVTLANADGMSVAMERFGTGALRRLHIEEKIPQRSDPAWYLERCHLDALASAHRLVELDLHASNGISLTDEDWASLIPSWPCLRYCRLQSGRRRRSRDAVPYVPQATTLLSLTSLAAAPILGSLASL